MLAIRMQRTGRKGHAMFRVIVQESRLTPTSGRVVAQIGHYDPHAKSATLEKEKAVYYLSNGAQPSERVARLFEAQGIELPSWVVKSEQKTRTTRNADKLRKNRPAEESAPVAEEAPAEEPEAAVEESPAAEEVAAETTEAPAEDTTES
jgi:small subunit ribosomal protein S16